MHAVGGSHSRWSCDQRQERVSEHDASSEREKSVTDLDAVARQALTDNHFQPELDADAQRELATLPSTSGLGGLRDLCDLGWSSIDNAESKDLDQIELVDALPDGGVRLRVAIADVDAIVPKGSALDRHAAANATSVYTGIAVYPMLPREVSEGQSSLLEGADRPVVVIELELTRDGTVRARDVYRAAARNHAKLAYDSVGSWLEGRGPVPPVVAAMPGLEEQLWLQDRTASLLKSLREKAGALELDTAEASAVGQNGKVQSITVTRKNRARDLIEDFMIAANVAIAQYLADEQRSAIRRVVRVPRRWDRIVALAATFGGTLPATPDARALADFLAVRRAADPLRFPDLSLSIVKLLGPGEYVLDRPGAADDEGHFGLAAHDYSHATAPNRRYADLVTQRLVKAAIAGAPAPYSDDELAAIAQLCTERENAANRVERVTRKAAAALLLAPRIGSVFDAIVTGVNKDGTYVRLLSPPAEGRVVHGEAGMDVGERVRVKLVATDPRRGFIDFAGVS
ncbi:MAG: RNB domain-containing ribonuclease [Gemmatimonadaceae bacterium]|nr:RNB domain-containing ribonuclease [Gemmatimonadaceae bacterium]